MTRRARFTPLLRAGVFAAAACAPPLANAGEVPFAAPLPVYTASGSVGHLVPVDVDRDGDQDLLLAHFGPDALVFLRNVDGSGASWSVSTVSTAGAATLDVAAADVDGDGDPDVISSSYRAAAVFWHENLDGLGASWAAHTVASNRVSFLAVADIDRDGDADVLTNSLQSGLEWHQNNGDGTAWTARTIVTSGPFVGFGLSAPDIDRDGDPDVLTVVNGTPVWYENAAGGTIWTAHTAGASSGSGLAAADIDRDGDPDVVWGRGWFENSPSGLWTLHTFGSTNDLHLPVPADVDGDGDIDVSGFRFTGTGSVANLLWYENLTGNGSSWATRPLGTVSYGSAVAVVDLDRDGDLDALSASGAVTSQVVRHRNETLHRNACFAPPVNMSTLPDAPEGIAIADVDRDGDLDLVSTHWSADLVLWHENLVNSSGFTPHTLATSLDGPYAVAAADVDGDGDTDVLTDLFSGGLRWLENTMAAVFIPHTISTTPNVYIGTLQAGDIDGDGDVDVLRAGYGGQTRWHRNDAGNGSGWSAIGIGGDSGALADLDRDGDLDVPAPNWFAGEVLWRENVTGAGTSWATHTIATLQPVDVTHAADLDGDGDTDFLDVSGMQGPEWRENQGGASVWTTHTVPGLGARHAAFDLDGDGDLDVAWSEGAGHSFGWHENLNGAATSWLAHTLPLAGSSTDFGSITAADLDRDGDLDLVADPVGLVWHENRGGQFSLAATNTAPGTANQGNLVSMLRVAATHLGRPGDGALELARLGILLEEAAGDPLTTAEANLLVESLRVYDDSNDNGFFDPADLLVASVGTLSLTGGVQPVTFTDGDANVSVGAGATRTYFVVVELTADASTQDPNRLRVTLLQLGPSASQAEHAAYDLPIAPACPADVSSGVTVATIPVELMDFRIE